ncbi:MAG: DUF885 domain-containing protein [Polyangiaceae bacterium]|nr:DUF885 domain-containing protein [Polyangiaceae bacterium]
MRPQVKTHRVGALSVVAALGLVVGACEEPRPPKPRGLGAEHATASASASASVSATARASSTPSASGATSSASGAAASSDAAARFAAVRDRLVGEWLDLAPQWGREIGLHEHDGRVADYGSAGIARMRSQAKAAHDALAAFRAEELGPDDALDLAIMRAYVRLSRFQLEELGFPTRRPQFYEPIFDVSSYLNYDYAPLEVRARALLAHEQAALVQAPSVLANLEATLSRPGIETAIKVFAGYAEYLRGDVKKAVGNLGDAAFKQDFAAANEALAKAAEDIAARLKKDWLPKGDDSYVLGRERYLAFVAAQEGEPVELADFERRAEEDLARNKAAYEELRKTVKPTRPKASELLEEARALMDRSRQFVVDKGLVSLPSEDRAVVRESPPFMRWNSAFLNMPGPFDSAKQSYYYISLPDPSWPAKEQEEYIFPRGVLLSTSVHEVWPGHFLQGLFVRNAPTKIQKMMGSYSFVEGWAHYTEQLMIEQGFGAEDPESRLGQLSDALLRNCRFVVSIGLHAKGMSLAAAEKRFMDDCFQDKASAREQAVRGTFDPGYFAYTVGKLAILELRAEAQQRLGARFDLRRFHDALLSHGQPPVALIRERVLHEIEAAAGP